VQANSIQMKKTAILLKALLASGIWMVAQLGSALACTPPDAPADKTEELCATQATYTLTAEGTDLKWYDNADVANSTPVQTGVATVDVTDETTIYYVTQTVDGCESSATEIKAKVADASEDVVFSPSNPSICNGQEVTIKANFRTGYWQVQPGSVDNGDGSVTVSSAAYVQYVFCNIYKGVYVPDAAAVQVTVDNTGLDDEICKSAVEIDLADYVTIENGTGITIAGAGVVNNKIDFASVAVNTPVDITITGTSSSGCVPETSETFTVHSPAAPTPDDAAPSFDITATTGTLSVSGTKTTGFNWYLPDASEMLDQSNSITIDPSTFTAGDHTFEVAEVINGCVGERASIVVTIAGGCVKPSVPTPIDATPSFDVASSSEDISVDKAQSSGFNWYYPDGTTTSLDASNVLNIDPSSLGLGDHKFYVTEVDGACESDSALITVTVIGCVKPATPDSTGSTVCPGANFELTVTGTSIKWYDSNEPTATPVATGSSFSPSAPGVYYVTDSDGDCESDKRSVAAEYIVLPENKISVEATSFCIGEEFIITASQTGGTFISDSVPTDAGEVGKYKFAGNGAGEINFAYELVTGQCKDTAKLNVYVVEQAKVGVVLESAILCSGDSVKLTPAIPGGTWTATGGTVNDYADSAYFLASVDTETDLEVTYSAGGCTFDSAVTVTVKPAKDPSVVDFASVVCEGNSVDIAVATAGGNWNSTDVAVTSDDTVFTYTPTTADGNPVELVYTIADGDCEVSAKIDITPMPVVSVALSDTVITVCSGEKVDIEAMVTPSIEGNWTTGAALPAYVADGTKFTVTPVFPEGYSFTVSYEVGDLETCGDSTIATINVLPVPAVEVNAEKLTVCTNEEVAVTVSPVGGTWNNDALVETDVQGTYTFSSDKVGSSILEYTVSGDYCSAKDQVVILVSAPAQITSFIGDTAICASAGIVDLTAYAVPSTGAFSGNGVDGTMFDPANVLAGEAIEIVYILGDKEAGCFDADTAVFKVVSIPSPAMKDTIIDDITSMTELLLVPSEYIDTASISWNNADSMITATGDSAKFATSLFTPAIYDFTVSQSVDGCQSVATEFAVIVKDPNCGVDLPTVAAKSYTLCPEEGAPELSATPEAEGDSVIWFVDKALTIAIDTALAFTPELNGATDTTFYVASKNGCLSLGRAITIEVVDPVLPTILLSETNICASDVALVATVSPEGGSLFVDGNEVSEIIPSAYTGTVEVLYVTGSGVCADTAKTELTVNMEETPGDLSADVAFEDLPAVLSSTLDSVVWYTSDMAELSSENPYTTSIADAGDYTYKFVSVNKTTGCVSDVATYTVKVAEPVGPDTVALKASIVAALAFLDQISDSLGIYGGFYSQDLASALQEKIAVATDSMRSATATEQTLATAKADVDGALVALKDSKVVLDLVALQTALATAKTKRNGISQDMIGDEPEQYKSELVAAIDGAIAYAETVVNKELLATQDTVAKAEGLLKTASDNLVANPSIELDSIALKQAIHVGDSLLALATEELVGTEPAKYHPDVVSDLREKLNDAKAVLDSATVQSSLNVATTALLGANEAFVLTPEESKEALLAKISDIEQFKSEVANGIGEQTGDYLPVAVTTLETALAAAKPVSTNIHATKEQIDAQISALSLAKTTALSQVVPPVSTKALEDSIAFAEAKIEQLTPIGTSVGEYPQSVIDALNAAISEAKATLTATGLTQVQADNASSIVAEAARKAVASKLGGGVFTSDELVAVLADAKKLYDQIKDSVGTDVGLYPEEVVDALKDLISAGEDAKTAEDIDVATAKLKTEIAGIADKKNVPVKPESMAFSLLYVEIKIGGTKTLHLNYEPENTTEKEVTWKSSDRKVVSVDENGVITARKGGKATITAVSKVDASVEASIVVTVEEVFVSSIEVKESVINLAPGEKATIGVTIFPDNASNKTLEFESSDEDVASVDQDGVVEAILPGKAVVTIWATDDSFLSEKVTVYVGDATASEEIADADVSVLVSNGILSLTVSEETQVTVSSVGGIVLASKTVSGEFAFSVEDCSNEVLIVTGVTASGTTFEEIIFVKK